MNLEVNPRDLEILYLSTRDFYKKIGKANKVQNSVGMSLHNPYEELIEYLDGLIDKIDSLRERHPYKPKE